MAEGTTRAWGPCASPTFSGFWRNATFKIGKELSRRTRTRRRQLRLVPGEVLGEALARWTVSCIECKSHSGGARKAEWGGSSCGSRVCGNQCAKVQQCDLLRTQCGSVPGQSGGQFAGAKVMIFHRRLAQRQFGWGLHCTGPLWRRPATRAL